MKASGCLRVAFDWSNVMLVVPGIGSFIYCCYYYDYSVTCFIVEDLAIVVFLNLPSRYAVNWCKPMLLNETWMRLLLDWVPLALRWQSGTYPLRLLSLTAEVKWLLNVVCLTPSLQLFHPFHLVFFLHQLESHILLFKKFRSLALFGHSYWKTITWPKAGPL